MVRLRRYPAAPWAFKSFPELKREEHIPTGLKMLKSAYTNFLTPSNLPSIFLILHGFDYLPRFFSVSFM